jgi:hypothetical protein
MSFEGYKKDLRDKHLNPQEGKENARTLESLLEKYNDKRVLVLAPPSVGKSTILQHMKNGIDLDMVFDDMPEEFKKHVLHHEWPFMFVDGDKKTIKYTEKEFDPNDTEHQDYLRETTELLTDYVQSKMSINAGHPGFGSTLVDADVVIYLKISDAELEKRIESRNRNTHRPVQIERVKAIKKNLEVDLERFRSEGGAVEEIAID